MGDSVTGAPGYEASPAALTEAAAGVADALAELASIGSVGAAATGRGVATLVLGVGSVGHVDVAVALGAFCGTWEWGVRALVQAGERIVDGLHGTATAYQKVEHAADGLLRRLALDLTGDPRADPARAATATWDELLPAPQPDPTATSWRLAGEHIATTWGADDSGQNPLQSQLDDLVGLREIGN